MLLLLLLLRLLFLLWASLALLRLGHGHGVTAVTVATVMTAVNFDTRLGRPMRRGVSFPERTRKVLVGEEGGNGGGHHTDHIECEA